MAEEESILSDPPASEEPGEQSQSADFDWKTLIPEDLKQKPVWANYPDFASMAKNHVDTLAYNVGALKLPRNDAPPEEWGRVWDKLGRPASPEGYQLPERDPEDPIQFDDGFLGEMKSVAHTAGLNPKQFAQLVEGYERYQRQSVQESQGLMDKTTQELQEEWGGAYERKVGLAQRAVQTLGGEDVMDALASTGIGNHAGFIRMMSRIGEALAEQGIVAGDVPGVPDTDQAKARLNEILAHPDYINARSTGHKALFEEAEKLFQLLYN